MRLSGLRRFRAASLACPARWLNAHARDGLDINHSPGGSAVDIITVAQTAVWRQLYLSPCLPNSEDGGRTDLAWAFDTDMGQTMGQFFQLPWAMLNLPP